MTKKVWFYIAFFIALFIGFYFALTRIIPGYGQVKLPVLSYVQPFSFTNQEGRLITEKDIEGKVVVAEYFFTTCKGICPKLNRNMQDVYNKFRDQEDFRILSHTVDPGVDDVARLKHYADSMNVKPETWWFLTGTKDSLYNAARKSYLLDSRDNDTIPIADQFIHTQFFALVDREGRVRKIFDGLKKDDLKELEKYINMLLKERPGKVRFVGNLFGNNPS